MMVMPGRTSTHNSVFANPSAKRAPADAEQAIAQLALDALHPPTRDWFEGVFDDPTPVQAGAWPLIATGQNALLFAPTGSGKTLAAFLAVIDRLLFGPPPQLPESAKTGTVRALYISPLKALGVDVDRNLRAPLTGISAVARQMGKRQRPVSVGVRTGDTSAKERQRMQRTPPEVLITTPESLYLMLTSKARQGLIGVESVIIDEIHALLPTKRGAHLMLSLERLERLRLQENPGVGALQRIGLSATQRPIEEAAQFLGGAELTIAESTETRTFPTAPGEQHNAPRFRPVKIVDTRAAPKLELRVEMPIEEMREAAPEAFNCDEHFNPDSDLVAGNLSRGPLPPSIWPAIYPHLIRCIEAHRSTIVFVNSRRLAERIAAAINEEVGYELARPHHGSLARETREETEDLLKTGNLRAIVATSSLELGIDMGAVDLVVQIEAPASIASGLQRVGRAGHHVGAVSKGVIYPKYRGDLLAATAAVEAMRGAQIESTRYLRNPLDLLAQHIVAMVALEDWPLEALFDTVRGAAPFVHLPKSAFFETLNLLSGRYPSESFGALRPRITWDRLTDTLSARQGAQRTAILNGGTIPDRGLFGVFLAADAASRKSRVGELDEEMVYELKPGDVFRLGASSWRVVEVTRDQVLVDPAPGEPGKMPFWRGEGLGRTLDFGLRIGALTRTISDASNATHTFGDLSPEAARILVAYVQEQVSATGTAPTDRRLVLERFRDEIGDWRVVLLSPFGARVHAPWAMCAARQLRQTYVDVDVVWTDDGIVFRVPEADRLPALADFLPDPDLLDDAVTEALADTSMFAARFRENAARALLLPRQSPARRTPLWMQRKKASDLLKVASQFSSFPILLETYRECLTDILDVEGLRQVLEWHRTRKLEIVEVESDAPSPFAQTVLFDFTGSFIYETDAPLAERRAEALALDHSQLKELIGTPNYRALLEAEAIDEVAEALARLAFPCIRHADDIHDLLLGLGDLSTAELRLRIDRKKFSEQELDAALAELARVRRIVPIRLAGVSRWVACEEAARYRDATGCVLPLGLPHALLDPVPDALDGVILRHARTHVGFGVACLVARYGIDPESAGARLESLTRKGLLIEGEFTPGATHREWIDRDVLGQIKRRSLARLRKTIEPVLPARFAQFLRTWAFIERPRRGLDGVLDVLEQLQGMPLLASALERDILPARVQRFHSGMLDELFQSGEILWQGIEPVGQQDGRIAIYLADQYPLLARSFAAESLEEPSGQIVALLETRGALTFEEIALALTVPPSDLLAPLWDAVWAGRISNDAFTALRSVLKLNTGAGADSARISGVRRRGRAGRFRSRRRQFIPGTEGRWYALPDPGTQTSATQHAEALARQLLERNAVVTREAVAAEGIPGGFSALYPVLRAMEEAGSIRRGYFIEGLGASQFALPAVVDRLRAGYEGAKSSESASESAWASAPEPVVLLAATDPANPYGAILPWPTTSPQPSPEPSLKQEAPNGATRTARLARSANARVALSKDGCLGYLKHAGAKGSATLSLFAPEDAERQRKALGGLASALIALAGRDGPFMLTEVNGTSTDRLSNPTAKAEDPAARALVAALIACGAENGYRGLRVVDKGIDKGRDQGIAEGRDEGEDKAWDKRFEKGGGHA